MNHRTLIMIGIRVGLIGTISTLGRELPLRSVWHPDCKWIPRNELDESCKVKILEEGSLSKDAKENASLFFSALWWSSYTNPHTENAWSHPSVDIVSNEWTPVFSIQHWRVVKAWYQAWYWNSITIEHDFNDTKIYSNYSHLDRIDVHPDDLVQAGEKIWEVGRSWFTMWEYWYHLDFQITTADSPAHPYWFHDCLWTSYISAVNLGECKDKLDAYTIDPLEFFKTYANLDLHPIIAYDAQQRGFLDVWWRVNDNESEVSVVRIQDVEEESDDDTTNAFTREEPSDTTVPAGPDVVHVIEEIDSVGENQEYIVTADKRFRIQWELTDYNKTLTEWEFTNLRVYIDDLLGNPISWSLPEPISIESSDSWISVLPGNIRTVRQWQKSIFLRLREAWTYTLTFTYWEQLLGSIDIEVE